MTTPTVPLDELFALARRLGGGICWLWAPSNGYWDIDQVCAGPEQPYVGQRFDYVFVERAERRTVVGIIRLW
jgi:hypothetical protein